MAFKISFENAPWPAFFIESKMHVIKASLLKKKAIQCCDWLIDSTRITTDTQNPAMISHDLVILPSATILTVRVTNVHSG